MNNAPQMRSPAPRANAENRANPSFATTANSMKSASTPDFAAIALSEDERAFVSENAGQAAYWSDLAREAAIIGDDALLAYATHKAATFARAFVGAVRDLLNGGAVRR
jgi:hypothetical protein